MEEVLHLFISPILILIPGYSSEDQSINGKVSAILRPPILILILIPGSIPENQSILRQISDVLFRRPYLILIPGSSSENQTILEPVSE